MALLKEIIKCVLAVRILFILGKSFTYIILFASSLITALVILTFYRISILLECLKIL